jgi:hypothetical protein
MAIQDFTAGQVLTAAQMDNLQANDYNQTVSTKTANYVLVAADKGTRVVMNAAGATTITVNTSLFNAGDTVVLQNIGAGVSTVTAGTATVSSAGPLAIPQYGSGTLYFTSAGVAIYFPSAVTIPPASSGLTLISSTTIGTAVSTVEVTGAFSSTYDNYRIIVSGGTGTAGNITMKFGATTTGYYTFTTYGTYSSDTINVVRQNNGASTGTIFYGEADGLDGVIDVRSPNLAKSTCYSGFHVSSNAANPAFIANGVLDDNTQYTAFTLTGLSGTMTGGTIKVYGYANS